MSENENKGTRIKFQTGRAFSIVPDEILTNKNLSMTARVVLAYLIGRGRGWIFWVKQVQSALGLSENRWAGARRELEVAGYLKQSKTQGEAGRWVWELEVYDTPILMDSIPGNSIPGFSRDGKPIHGKPGDITEDCKQSDLNKGLETSLEREEPLRGSQALSSSSNPNSNSNSNSKAVSRKVDEAWSFPTAWRDFARKERQDLSGKQIEHLIEKFTGYYSGAPVNDRLFLKWKGWVMREVVQAQATETKPGALPTNGTHSGYATRDYGKGGLI